MVVVACGEMHSPRGPLDCGNSGTTARLRDGVVAGARLQATFVGDAAMIRTLPPPSIRTQNLICVAFVIGEQSVVWAAVLRRSGFMPVVMINNWPHQHGILRLERPLGALLAFGLAALVAQSRVVAQIQLSPLPAFPQWQGATGTAVMRATAGQQVMLVTLHAPQRPGFYEVWLLARDGVSMISLGDLNADHTGTFTVPPGVDLRNYSRIDVSLQPFNGSTLHAKTSVVRGSLPPAALAAGAGPESGSSA